ncbi:cobyric acid synthase [Cenarchaeum symbiosum A]|uniref:Probable cobyric acid synthase n=1 Tax=Cenarchaeum symbiosum (strain A) TaxID=414004 RepID=A0RZ32_CENSY|nr:cobyric acid synthase [Cenarchaeum symbiosum A]
MSSIMVQGTSSGAGKSVLVTALCRIFSDMGLSVAPFKSQNMSNLSYTGDGFEISRAQAIQAVAARAEITPDMNPVLLKPRGGKSTVYLGGRRRGVMDAAEYYRIARRELLPPALSSLARLRREHDVVVIEGAGSPAEINLRGRDITNMAIASRIASPVILITDIERGGSFAALVGTLSLLEERHRELVRGLVFNKFRGDEGILRPGFARLRRITGKRVLGVIPKAKLGIPEEDSLDASPGGTPWDGRPGTLDREIGKLASLVEKSLDMRAIGGMIK